MESPSKGHGRKVSRETPPGGLLRPSAMWQVDISITYPSLTQKAIASPGTKFFRNPPQPLLTHQPAELPPKDDFWSPVKLFIPQDVYLSRLLFLATRVNV